MQKTNLRQKHNIYLRKTDYRAKRTTWNILFFKTIYFRRLYDTHSKRFPRRYFAKYIISLGSQF